MKQIIKFDTIESEERPWDLSTLVRWLKDDVVVKEMELQVERTSMYNPCEFCLKYYGEIVLKDQMVKNYVKPEWYTSFVCPKTGEHCSCGEERHRISCPLGFDKYFMP